jgi:hypothetical protein
MGMSKEQGHPIWFSVISTWHDSFVDPARGMNVMEIECLEVLPITSIWRERAGFFFFFFGLCFFSWN